MKIRPLSIIVSVLLTLGFILLKCELPVPPEGAEAAHVSLFVKSSNGEQNVAAITDTVKGFDTIGVILSLTTFIDSTIIEVKTGEFTNYHFITKSKKTQIDTVYYTVTFSTTGDRSVTATGYINGYPNSEAAAIIHIVEPGKENHPPKLEVTGTRDVVAGATISLTATTTDPDSNQIVTVTAEKLPAGATFTDDTLRWTTALADTGTDTLIFVATDNGSPAMTDTDTVIVTLSVPAGNQPPVLTVSGRHVAVAGSTVVLAVAATDPITGKHVTITAIRLPEEAVFTNDTLRLGTTLAGIGSDTAIFVATDDSNPELSDTEIVVITITETLQNTPPAWNSDTLHLTGEAGVATMQSLTARYADPEGDSVTLSQLPGAPAGATLAAGVWQFTPAATDTGKLTFLIVAADPFGATDTLIIALSVIALTEDPEDRDPPVMHRIAPAIDSQTVASASYEVKVSFSDASGIAAVNCSMGAATFTTSVSADTIYSALVTGLQPATWNSVRFIATDSATTANSCTLSVALKYDPTAPDTNPPSITLLSPSKDTVVLNDSCLVTVRCTDASGVANVKIGTTSATRRENSTFSAMVKGLGAGENLIVIAATDSAPTPHTDSTTVHIGYDSDATGPTLTLTTPAKDSAVTSATNYTVVLTCTDASGVLSVNGTMGTANFTGTRGNNNLWNIPVTALAQGVYSAITFTATDSSGRANTTEHTMYIKYDPTATDDAPPVISMVAPVKDTTITADSCTIRVRCTDESGVANVTIAGVAAARQANDIFAATVKGLVAGKNTVTIVATDSATTPHKDSASIIISYDSDVTGPTLSRTVPIRDSAATNAASYTVTLSCTDPSGVVSVNGTMGTTTFTGVRGSSNLWTVAVTGLAQGVYSTITFTATDSSLRGNTSKVTLYIKYDPTKDDADGPTIMQSSGPASGSTVSAASVTIVSAITDPSGIESVTWTLNGGAAQLITPAAGSYSLTATLTEGVENTIIITVVDNATGHNPSTQTILLTYIIPPKITNQPTGATVCFGGDATVSVTATGTAPLIYQWQDATGNITGATSASYKATKTATLTCVVSNGAGIKATSTSATVTVAAAVTVAATPANAGACSGGSATFTATATGGTGFEYQWYKGTPPTGTSISGATTATYTANAADGSGTFYCSAKNADDCSGTSDKVTFTVAPAVAVTVTPASAGACSGGSATFTAAAVGGSGFSFAWYKTGSTTAAAATAALTLSATDANAGTYHCVVKNSDGCTETSSDVTFTKNAAVSLAIAASADAVCSGSSVTLTATPTGGSTHTYQWYSGVTKVGINSATYKAPAAGTYKCEATSSAGCMGSAQKILTAKTISTKPTIKVKNSGSTTVCPGTKITLEVTGTLGTGAAWEWSTGETGTSIEVTPTAAQTTYSVKGTGDCGSSDAGAITINLIAGPTPPTGMGVSPGLSICTGTEVTLTAQGGSGTRRWYADGVVIQGNTSDTYKVTPQSATTTYATSTVNDCGVESAKVSKTVTRFAPPVAKTISVDAGNSVCNGLSTVLRVNNSAQGNTYEWYRNDVLTNFQTDVVYITFTSSNVGTYHCVIINGNGCKVVTNKITITIKNDDFYPNETAATIYTCLSTPLTVNASCAAKYDWYFIRRGMLDYELISSLATDVSGQGTSTLTVNPDVWVIGKLFYCIVTNFDGTTHKSVTWNVDLYNECQQ